jgi:hypothetical protein
VIETFDQVDPQSVPPTTTAWVPIGPAAIVPPGEAYGTSLPASPSDGQSAVLVDSTTNPTYTWRFRYNNGSTSAYKWEFVGGVPWAASYLGATQAISTVGSYVVALPQLTLPRAGEYVFDLTAIFTIGSAATLAQIALYNQTGSADLSALGSAGTVQQPTYNLGVSLSGVVATATAGQTISTGLWVSQAGCSTGNRFIKATPKRVS